MTRSTTARPACTILALLRPPATSATASSRTATPPTLRTALPDGSLHLTAAASTAAARTPPRLARLPLPRSPAPPSPQDQRLPVLPGNAHSGIPSSAATTAGLFSRSLASRLSSSGGGTPALMGVAPTFGLGIATVWVRHESGSGWR